MLHSPSALGLALLLSRLSLTAQYSPGTEIYPTSSSALAVAPYLQALSPTSVSIHWHSSQLAYGWVEYGESPNLGHRRDRQEHGLRSANVTHHHVVLTDLQPGRPYHYRVHTRAIQTLAAYQVDFGDETVSELLSFQTLPAANQSVTALVFNDLHNNTNTLALLRRAAGSEPFDLSLFNGDCLADPSEPTTTLQTLNAFFQETQADAKPAFLIRGNHETRGTYARQLPNLIAWPNDRPYFAFTAGPVRWLVLDCGEDKPDDHKEYYGLADFDSFRREQTEWLKQELASQEFSAPPWRVLVHHIPLYSQSETGGFHTACRDLWADLLARANIDLALNGHTHHRAFYPAESVGAPYPIAVGGAPASESAVVMRLKASADNLTLQVIDTEGREVFPTFQKHKPLTP